MIHFAHALRLASTLACGIVLIAFAMWATDEAHTATNQQAGTAGGAVDGTPAPVAVAPPVAASEAEHGGVRGAIESANATLVGPFEDVVQSTNEWVQHGVPALLALLAYGLLARLLVSYMAPQRV